MKKVPKNVAIKFQEREEHSTVHELNIEFFCSKSERIQTLIQDRNLSGYALKQKGACIDVVKASQDLTRQFLQKIESR